MSSLDLNGSTALVESIKQQLGNIRRDWRVEAAQINQRLTEGLLELERTMSRARDLLADISDGRDGVDGVHGKDGKDGTDGKDGAPGRDGVDGARGLNGQDGAPGRDGVDGKDGASGRDGVDGTCGLDGKDGAPGANGASGERGERGEQGPPGVFVAPLPYKAGQITYGGQLIYHEGSTFCALRDTAAPPPHADFQPVAYKGRDAYGGRACGLYKATETYRAMDVAAWDSKEWRATRDNPGKPGEGDGWVISTFRGETGARGAKGEKGERGAPGKDGIGIKEIAYEPGLTIIRLTDGREFAHVDQ